MVTAVSKFLNTSKGYIMMMNATASVVEGKMEPITRSASTQPLVVTGQYLFDNFVKADEVSITKMDLIRNWSTQADALQIKGACDKMVELAVLIDYPEGKPKKATRGTKEQSAMNCRTIIQQAWGALKNARTELDSLGYDDSTGYQDMRVLAKKALDSAKVNWKGDAVLTDKDKEVKRLVREQREETAALQDVQKETPRMVGESLADWNTRTFALAQTAMEQARAANTAETVAKVLESLISKYDENTLFQLAEGLMEHLGFSVGVPEEVAQEEEVAA